MIGPSDIASNLRIYSFARDLDLAFLQAQAQTHVQVQLQVREETEIQRNKERKMDIVEDEEETAPDLVNLEVEKERVETLARVPLTIVTGIVPSNCNTVLVGLG